MTVGALLAEALPGTATPPSDLTCAGVTHDSRRVTPGVVFVALRGQQADGTAFASQAIDAGAVAVIAESAPSAPATVPWLVVPDARVALARLAAAYFGHPSHAMKVIGVTGTNGKTTTSYLIRAIVEAAGLRCGLVGTVAYQVGDRVVEATRTTPEAPEMQALLREMIDVGCGACAMEVSSHALALHRVDEIRFAAAVFTNLTRDHLDFHADMEDYFSAKRRLFDMLPPGTAAVVNLDDPRGASLADRQGRVTYAITRAADVRPGPLTFTLEGLHFDVSTPWGPVRIDSELVGRPNVYNILAAVAATMALGVPADAVTRGVQALRAVPGRFQRVSGPKDDVTVIVDYAHTDDALRNLLETARMMAGRRVITVFGAGGDRDRTKRPLMGMVAARLSDLVVLTSDNPRSEDPARILEEVQRGAEAERRARGSEVITVLERGEAIGEAVRRAAPGDVVLIAGKGHETDQEIRGRRLPFDDAAVARKALEARRVPSRAS